MEWVLRMRACVHLCKILGAECSKFGPVYGSAGEIHCFLNPPPTAKLAEPRKFGSVLAPSAREGNSKRGLITLEESSPKPMEAAQTLCYLGYHGPGHAPNHAPKPLVVISVVVVVGAGGGRSRGRSGRRRRISQNKQPSSLPTPPSNGTRT